MKQLSSRLRASGVRICAAIACFACLGAWTTAVAELDGGLFQILQNGVQVGVIYVPERAAGTTMYGEDWILFPNYAYPGAAKAVTTEIVPQARNPYSSEAEFLRTAPWGIGFRYVRVISDDTPTLPGRE